MIFFLELIVQSSVRDYYIWAQLTRLGLCWRLNDTLRIAKVASLGVIMFIKFRLVSPRENTVLQSNRLPLRMSKNILSLRTVL